ncbi:MAG TPA: hypothetical protein VF384_11835 [Planctomycetota bacterium]
MPLAPRRCVPLPLLLATASALLASTALAQQTLVVGPGQPFTTIPPAIAAAQPGDTVLVLAGTYTQTLDIDKGIRLVGRGANLQLQLFPAFPAVDVHDVPAGETFAMSGFTLLPPPSALSTLRLEVRNCAGPVAIRDLSSNNAQRWSIAVLGCEQVHIASSFVYGITSTDSMLVVEHCSTEPAAVTGMQVNSGNVVLVGSTLRGGSGPFGGAGLRLSGGTAVATRCEIRGSPGWPAIETVQGLLVLDPSTVLVPGTGAPSVSGPIAPASLAFASLVAATDGAILTVDSHGPAGQWFATFLSLAAPQWNTPIGISWLDPATALLLPLASYDPVTRTHSLAVPHPPLPPGIVFTLQPVHFGPQGPTFGIPSLLTTP